MLNTELDYSNNNLIFNYLNLRKYLFELYKQGIQDINIFLLVSLEKEYYQGDNLKRIIKDLKNLSNNLITDFDILDENGKPTGKKTEKIKFKVNKISLDVGDIANRWRWIYRYNEKYMLENNITNEEDIPQDIVEQIARQSYETAKQQGIDWFKNHAIDAINEVLDSRLRGNDSSSQSNICHSRGGGNPEKPSNLKKNSTKLIDKDFQLTDRITEIFEGNNETPKIEHICYDYWLNHPKYKIIEKALLEVRNLDNSVVEKAYDHEVKYYNERTAKKGIFEKFPDMFFKYSKIYQFDETMPMVIRHQDVKNNFEFYWFGRESCYTEVFRGKKALNNEIIKHYLDNELKGIVDRNYTSIKEKNN